MSQLPPMPPLPAPENRSGEPSPVRLEGGASEAEQAGAEGQARGRGGFDSAGTITLEDKDPRHHLRDEPRATFWMSLLVVAAVLAAVAVVVLRDENHGRAEEGEARSQARLEEREAAAELERWIEATGDHTPRVKEALRAYAAATTVEEARPLIRASQRDSELLEQRWQPLVLRPGAAEESSIELHSSPERDWISVDVETDDFREQQLVYIVDGDELQLDWRASFEVGEVEFSELRSLPDDAEVSMYVIAKPVVFSTPLFPEDEWHCFELSERFGDGFVWGFFRRNSAVDEEMAGIMRRDTVLFHQVRMKDLRLRLRRPPGLPPGQFEIVAIDGSGWIEP